MHKLKHTVLLAGLLGSLLAPVMLLAQTEQKELVLTWDDYKGAVPATSYFAATTVSYVKIGYAAAVNGMIAQPVYVWCEFSPARSWVNRSRLHLNGHQRLLAHEVNHYRLNIICAKLLQKSITGYKVLQQKRLQSLTATFTKAFDRRNRRYDAETNYGSNISRQLEWEAQISRELAGLQSIKLVKPGKE